MEEQYTIEQLASIVESEGLDYTILYYLSPDKIEDEELKKIWIEARILLEKINKKLEPFME